MTVRELLEQAKTRLAGVGVDSPRVDAELLLGHVLGQDRRWLWTYPDAVVSPAQEAEFFALLARRERREPLAYLLGEWEFYGRPFYVSPAVLIPRPETELLVEAVLDWAKSHGARDVVDVGTGSGAIAVTLAAEMPSLQLTAIDLSPQALEMAQRNARRHGVAGRITWLEGDLLAPLPHDPPVDVIVANLPYIAEEEMPTLMPEVRDYEPRMALAAAAQGLALVFRLIDESRLALKPGGLLALELGLGQADSVSAYLSARGWQAIRVVHDYAGIARHLLAETPGHAGRMYLL